MAIEIRQTTVTPAGTSQAVQLHIADAPLDDESASIVVRIDVEIPREHGVRLEAVQLSALKVASQALRDLINSMGS